MDTSFMTFSLNNFARSGFAEVLQEQLPASMTGISQYLYVNDEGQYDWLDSALATASQITEGSNYAFAELALRQASHISQYVPRIYNSPERGVVIENREKRGFLTLLIEDTIGLIVRSADDFQVRAEFEINPHSINEMLARYNQELKLLLLPDES